MRAGRYLRNLQPPTPMGVLSDSCTSNVPIIRKSATANELEDESSYTRQEKFHPDTLEGKSPNKGMAKIPKEISQNISKVTLDWSPQELRQCVAKLYHDLQKGKAHSPAFEKMDADAHVVGLFLQNYVSIANSLREIRKRRPDFRPKSVLDVGFGPATGLLAAREIFGVPQTPSDGKKPETSVLIGHPHMKARAKELLGNTENVLFRDEVPTPNSPKRYDLIIATHQLYQHGQKAENLVDSHTQRLGQLLNKDGVLLFIERGDPLGFESIALAREQLTRDKYDFNVVGPCRHTHQCPLQIGLETRQWSKHPGRENWCRFSQNVDRPKFTTELKKGQYLSQKWIPGMTKGAGGKALKGKGRPGSTNNEIATYSWLAMENARPAVNDATAHWPRIMKQPLKRSGHVTMEVCASNGLIEHWTVPRSQGKQAYHDVRKANAADVWALDAKVKQARGGLRKPETLKESRLSIAPPSTEKRDADTKYAPEWLDGLCRDWWQPSANPFFKYSSHQERILNENMAAPVDDSFLGAMEIGPVEIDSKREKKLLNKELQGRYM